MSTCVMSAAVLFTDAYVRQLRQGDPAIEGHFARYFSRDLDRWLWPRLRSAALVEEIRQETLCRVLSAIKNGSAFVSLDRRPLPLFVHGVCRRVLLEHWRKSTRTVAAEDPIESPAPDMDPEQGASVAEEIARLRNALQALPTDAQRLIALVYFRESDRADVSQAIGVKQDYLRVLVFRALRRLRTAFFAAESSTAGNVGGRRRARPFVAAQVFVEPAHLLP